MPATFDVTGCVNLFGLTKKRKWPEPVTLRATGRRIPPVSSVDIRCPLNSRTDGEFAGLLMTTDCLAAALGCYQPANTAHLHPVGRVGTCLSRKLLIEGLQSRPHAHAISRMNMGPSHRPGIGAGFWVCRHITLPHPYDASRAFRKRTCVPAPSELPECPVCASG